HQFDETIAYTRSNSLASKTRSICTKSDTETPNVLLLKKTKLNKK
ncbi:24664_t:CDS:1, partial [Gigaspora rosea]